MDRIYFITSSRIKLLNVQHLAREFELSILQQFYYGKAYTEPRSGDRDALLLESFKDAFDRWSKGVAPSTNFFFIEDTSVIIPALSTPNKEYPGTDVKFWMAETAFTSLDRQLRDNNNNRSAIVRSDVLLYMPPRIAMALGISAQFLQFTAKTYGSIVEKEMPGVTNVVYPWLDQKSFSKWFVPEGKELPLSLLPVHEADQKDIRVGSAGKMLSFLADNHLIKRKAQESKTAVQGVLFNWSSLFLACGLTCAGKTTIGEYLSAYCGYFHAEASDFMRVAYEMRNKPESSPLTLEAFAKQALIDDPAIVTNQIIDFIESIKEPIIITGLRSAREIDAFKIKYKGPLEIKVAFIHASEEVRYARAKKRDRDDAPLTSEDFKLRDITQLEMGLEEIRREHFLEAIVNDRSIAYYRRKFLTTYKLTSKLTVKTPNFIRREGRNMGLEERIILALFLKQRTSKVNQNLTTTEIAQNINSVFSESSIETSKNNVSRYFNQRPRPYFRRSNDNGPSRYRLSQTGFSKALSTLRNLKPLRE